MTEWISYGKDFIAADVIRWTEGAWEKRGRRSPKSIKIADRVVTAQVLRQDKEGWVYLLVHDCAVSNEQLSRKPVHLKKDEKVRRKKHTIQKGKPERLRWSDETARESVISSNLTHSPESG